MVISNRVRGWLSLTPLVLSVTVSIFALYHFLVSRALRKAVNNHVIILLLTCGLILELTNNLWYLAYYHTGVALSSTPAFCFAWVFISSVMYPSIYILMAWASIERHIIIFYPNWFATKRKRFFLHYIPLAVCILWPLIFYFVFFFIVPCNIPLNYKTRLCGLYACVGLNPSIALLDSLANYILPAFITVIFSVVLFVRVLYSRYRIRHRIEWRNYKKMAMQLLPISALCILLQFPPMILYAAYSAGLSRQIAVDYYSDSLYFWSYVVLFTPFASVVALPELRTKCRNVMLFCKRRRAVGPQILTITRFKAGQAAVAPPVIS